VPVPCASVVRRCESQIWNSKLNMEFGFQKSCLFVLKKNEFKYFKNSENKYVVNVVLLYYCVNFQNKMHYILSLLNMIKSHKMHYITLSIIIH
jgi:hypothetical protein